MKLRKLPSCGASGVAYRVRRGKAQAPGKAILQHASACKKRAQLIQLAYKEAREEAWTNCAQLCLATVSVLQQGLEGCLTFLSEGGLAWKLSGGYLEVLDLHAAPFAKLTEWLSPEFRKEST